MTPSKILHLEDNPLDAELVRARLARDGFASEIHLSADRRGFEAALRAGGFDLILGDYHVPGFGGLEALELAQALRPEVPFVFVSGAMGEERAIESLRRGATDYVLKHRMERLVPAVRRALEEARVRAEREAAERELRDNDRRKDEFLAMLAHELRNPIAAIANAARVARAEPGDSLADALDTVDRQVHHLAHLIDDLLDVSRITRGKIAMRLTVLDAAEVARSAQFAVAPLIRERGHRIASRIEPGLWVHADSLRLEQVLTNLLNNAAKYTEAGGSLEFEAFRDGADVVFRVRDDGIGIPPDSLEDMFKLFHQGDRAPARSEGGLGIGLTLVKSLTELHGGRVSAASEGIGRGCEFTVRLPGAAPASADAPAPQPACTAAVAAAAEPSPKRVLVVDDHVDTGRFLARFLKLQGHDVRLAHDGPSALTTSHAHHPEVILLDIGLPGMDGFEVAERLRADGAGDAVIVAVSGYGQAEDRERSRRAGFDYHLVKPVDLDDLGKILTVPGRSSVCQG